MVIQSNSTIGVIAIALERAGLFSEQQAVLLILGAGPGVALSTYFMSATLQGVSRQILLYQGIINAIGGCGLAALLGLDAMTGHHLTPPLVHVSGLHGFPAAAANILPWVYLASMIAALLSGIALLPVAVRLLKWLSPPTIEQDLSHPMYLHDEALSVPDTALDLAEKEQLRLFSTVVQTIDSVRSEAVTSAGADRASLARAGSELGAVINGFLGELIDGDLSGESAARLLVLDRRQDHLQALLDTTGEIAALSAAARLSDQPAALVDRLKESLSLIFLSAQDAWSSRDATDIDLLLKVTADRGDLMERLRRSMTGGVLDNAEASTLFYLTSLFERAVWLVRQIGLTLDCADAPPV